MTRNIGSLDRMIRLVVGVVLLALVFVGPQTPWGYLGLIPIVTALFGFCPLYAALGMNTDHSQRAPRGRPA